MARAHPFKNVDVYPGARIDDIRLTHATGSYGPLVRSLCLGPDDTLYLACNHAIVQWTPPHTYTVISETTHDHISWLCWAHGTLWFMVHVDLWRVDNGECIQVGTFGEYQIWRVWTDRANLLLIHDDCGTVWAVQADGTATPVHSATTGQITMVGQHLDQPVLGLIDAEQLTVWDITRDGGLTPRGAAIPLPERHGLHASDHLVIDMQARIWLATAVIGHRRVAWCYDGDWHPQKIPYSRRGIGLFGLVALPSGTVWAINSGDPPFSVANAPGQWRTAWMGRTTNADQDDTNFAHEPVELLMIELVGALAQHRDRQGRLYVVSSSSLVSWIGVEGPPHAAPDLLPRYSERAVLLGEPMLLTTQWHLKDVHGIMVRTQNDS